jgi:hypothetical protein
MVADPIAPVAGDEKVSDVPPVQVKAAPPSVMTIFPVGGTRMTGLRVTDMVTGVELRTALLKVIAGGVEPRCAVVAKINGAATALLAP